MNIAVEKKDRPCSLLPVSSFTTAELSCWALDGEAGPELSLAGQRTERSAARLGAPQAAVFDFEAQAAGQKELTFNLVPPGGGDAARSYTLSVTVSE